MGPKGFQSTSQCPLVSKTKLKIAAVAANADNDPVTTQERREHFLPALRRRDESTPRPPAVDRPPHEIIAACLSLVHEGEKLTRAIQLVQESRIRAQYSQNIADNALDYYIKSVRELAKWAGGIVSDSDLAAPSSAHDLLNTLSADERSFAKSREDAEEIFQKLRVREDKLDRARHVFRNNLDNSRRRLLSIGNASYDRADSVGDTSWTNHSTESSEACGSGLDPRPPEVLEYHQEMNRLHILESRISELEEIYETASAESAFQADRDPHIDFLEAQRELGQKIHAMEKERDQILTNCRHLQVKCKEKGLDTEMLARPGFEHGLFGSLEPIVITSAQDAQDSSEDDPDLIGSVQSRRISTSEEMGRYMGVEGWMQKHNPHAADRNHGVGWNSINRHDTAGHMLEEPRREGQELFLQGEMDRIQSTLQPPLSQMMATAYGVDVYIGMNISKQMLIKCPACGSCIDKGLCDPIEPTWRPAVRRHSYPSIPLDFATASIPLRDYAIT